MFPLRSSIVVQVLGRLNRVRSTVRILHLASSPIICVRSNDFIRINVVSYTLRENSNSRVGFRLPNFHLLRRSLSTLSSLPNCNFTTTTSNYASIISSLRSRRLLSTTLRRSISIRAFLNRNSRTTQCNCTIITSTRIRRALVNCLVLRLRRLQRRIKPSILNVINETFSINSKVSSSNSNTRIITCHVSVSTTSIMPIILPRDLHGVNINVNCAFRSVKNNTQARIRN